MVHDCIVDPTQQSGPPDVDQSMKELLKQPGVEGYMVFNDTGEYTSLQPLFAHVVVVNALTIALCFLVLLVREQASQ